MILNCIDLRSNRLISFVAALRGKTFLDEEIHKKDLSTLCSYLNLNPVLLVRHSKNRVEELFQFFVTNDPLEKTKYHINCI